LGFGNGFFSPLLSPWCLSPCGDVFVVLHGFGKGVAGAIGDEKQEIIHSGCNAASIDARRDYKWVRRQTSLA